MASLHEVVRLAVNQGRSPETRDTAVAQFSIGCETELSTPRRGAGSIRVSLSQKATSASL